MNPNDYMTEKVIHVFDTSKFKPGQCYRITVRDLNKPGYIDEYYKFNAIVLYVSEGLVHMVMAHNNTITTEVNIMKTLFPNHIYNNYYHSIYFNLNENNISNTSELYKITDITCQTEVISMIKKS